MLVFLKFFNLMWLLNYVTELPAKCCGHGGQCFVCCGGKIKVGFPGICFPTKYIAAVESLENSSSVKLSFDLICTIQQKFHRAGLLHILYERVQRLPQGKKLLTCKFK